MGVLAAPCGPHSLRWDRELVALEQILDVGVAKQKSVLFRVLDDGVLGDLLFVVIVVVLDFLNYLGDTIGT